MAAVRRDARSTRRRGSAEDFAVIHYHRPDGDYGDAVVHELQRLLGRPHVGRAPGPGSRVDVADQARRARIASAVFFKLDLDRRGDRARVHPPSRRHQGSRSGPVPRPRQHRARGLVPVRPRRRRQEGQVPAADPGRVRGLDANLAATEGALADRGHARLGHRPAARRRLRAPCRADGGLAVDGGGITGGWDDPAGARLGRPVGRAQGEVAAPRRLPGVPHRGG